MLIFLRPSSESDEVLEEQLRNFERDTSDLQEKQKSKQRTKEQRNQKLQGFRARQRTETSLLGSRKANRKVRTSIRDLATMAQQLS
jgi:hypothetical protein